MMSRFEEIKPDRIVFTGDLVHSKNQMTPELIEIVAWVLTECAKIAKTVLIPGNHDFLNNNLNRLDALTPIIDSLKNPEIVYYRDRGVYEDENVSWCVYSQFQGNIPPEISEGKGYKIGLFHDPIQGLTTDTGYDFGDHAYDINKFKGLDIVLCGDIHKRQTLWLDQEIEVVEEDVENYLKKGWQVNQKNKLNKKTRIVQVGSTIQQNFGEKVRNHGFGIYDIDKEKYEFVDLINPRPFLTFKITDIEDLEHGTEKLTNY
jgi:DNA repair exonuclease SbcCD nuclease subunit